MDGTIFERPRGCCFLYTVSKFNSRCRRVEGMMAGYLTLPTVYFPVANVHLSVVLITCHQNPARV